MGINIGSKELVDAKLGNKQIKEIYLGNNLLWPEFNSFQYTKIWVPDTSMPFYTNNVGTYLGMADWAYTFYNTVKGVAGRYGVFYVINKNFFYDNSTIDNDIATFKYSAKGRTNDDLFSAASLIYCLSNPDTTVLNTYPKTEDSTTLRNWYIGHNLDWAQKLTYNEITYPSSSSSGEISFRLKAKTNLPGNCLVWFQYFRFPDSVSIGYCDGIMYETWEDTNTGNIIQAEFQNKRWW